MPSTRRQRSSLHPVQHQVEEEEEEFKKEEDNDDSELHHEGKPDDDEEDATPIKRRYVFDGLEFATYEAMVDAKRKRNFDMLVKSGLMEAVTSMQKAVPKSTKRTKLPKKVEAWATNLITRRRSDRLAGVPSDGHYVEDERNGKVTIAGSTKSDAVDRSSSMAASPKEAFFQNRINDGSDLSIRQAVELNDSKWIHEDSVERAEKFVGEELASIPPTISKPAIIIGKESPKSVIDSFPINTQLAAVSVDDPQGVTKVTVDRIYSIAAHPSLDRLLVAAGDKQGTVGLWDVDAAIRDDGSSHNTHMIRIHNRPVSYLHWTQDNGIVSASYDGTVRKLDVSTGTCQEIFATYDGDSKYAEDLGYGLEDVADGSNFWVQSLTPDHRSDPDRCFFLSTSVGTAIHVDLRVGQRKVTFQQVLSEKKINTLSLHPNGHSLASAGLDCTLRIWDVRNWGGPSSSKRHKSVTEFHAGKSINSAYFSPSGSTIVTTTMANTLDIIKDAHVAAKNLQATKRVRHDNQTGRWLSTFMATWHPSLDIFVVGSMNKPRTMDVFDNNGNLVRAIQGDALTAVVSRCCFHPGTDRLVLFGGNSSGRVTVVRK